MAAKSITDVLIVGGGASGVLLACHLLKDPDAPIRVTLFEKRPDIGLGIAYGTANPNHLLNVRAFNMSAFPEDPDHFWRWLLSSGEASRVPCPDQYCFVPRPVYGRYIAGLLEKHRLEAPHRLRIVQGECAAYRETTAGVEILLASGSRYEGDIAVMATGNEIPPAEQPALYADPWSSACENEIGSGDTVLILGTGLTMVDHVLTLINSGHQGRIIAVSRRGLLPHGHRPVKASQIPRSAIPFGKDVAILLRWVRALVRDGERKGEDWRGVIDGLRPFTHEIWRRLSLRSKSRFLRHARVWWDVHRHRMAPEVEAQVDALIGSGRLTIVRGRLLDVRVVDAGAEAFVRRRGKELIETIVVQKLIECRGVDNNPARTRNPIIRALLEDGFGRPDPLNIGLEVDDNCAVVDLLGKSSRRLFAIGPLTRPVFWEIIAVPDIRTQCAALAARLVERAAACQAAA